MANTENTPNARPVTDPDAELFEIGREHAALIEKIRAADDDLPNEEFNKLMDRSRSLEAAAMALPITTLTGLGVLARMARQSVIEPALLDETHAAVLLYTVAQRAEALGAA